MSILNDFVSIMTEFPFYDINEDQGRSRVVKDERKYNKQTYQLQITLW